MTIQLAHEYDLVFDIYDDDVAGLWLDRMRYRNQWPMDDPCRFYGFGSLQTQQQDAERRILEDIRIINGYQPIVERAWTSIDDQDMLNYLHHVFECYHGLLDQQTHDWWANAPTTVRQALARLNVDVHRAESVSRSRLPRFVCTWYGQPKTNKLTIDQIEQHGRLNIEWGGVYLNYVDIGKTVEELAIDQDIYIKDEAFRPFQCYSSDFVVRFYDKTIDTEIVDKYFSQHRDFFVNLGIDSSQHALARPYVFKVAQLRHQSRQTVVNMIQSNQQITDIKIHETS